MKWVDNAQVLSSIASFVLGQTHHVLVQTHGKHLAPRNILMSAFAACMFLTRVHSIHLCTLCISPQAGTPAKQTGRLVRLRSKWGLVSLESISTKIEQSLWERTKNRKNYSVEMCTFQLMHRAWVWRVRGSYFAMYKSWRLSSFIFARAIPRQSTLKHN